MYIMGMIILVIFAVIGLCAFLSAVIDFCCCKCRGICKKFRSIQAP